LTPPPFPLLFQSVTQEMLTFLRTLRGKVTTGMVGGSDLVKQREQLGEDVLELFDFVFPENGLAAFHLGKSIGKTSFRDFLGEARLKELINFALLYIANLDIPIKRGTFIEFRNGMLNVSPIGRNCSQEERDEFERYDLANGIRATMVKVLEARFANFGLKYSIGGQISFDVFPIVSCPVSTSEFGSTRTLSSVTQFPSQSVPFSRRAGTKRTRSSMSTLFTKRSTSLVIKPSPAATTMKSSHPLGYRVIP
jgi:hypothetical protein